KKPFETQEMLTSVKNSLNRATLENKNKAAESQSAQSQKVESTFRFLERLNAETVLRKLMHSLLHFMQEITGCEALGIRLRKGDDFPYYEVSGFSDDFVASETHLCVEDLSGQLERDDIGNPVLECMCENVIRGRFDSSKPFFTEFGSFVTNSTTRLLAGTSEQDRQARTRNRCNGEGYESVLLIPLRTGGKTFGLLQFNDRQKGRFPQKIVEHLERIAGNVALALAQRESKKALKESHERLKTILDNMDAHIYITDMETHEVLFSNLYGRKAYGDSMGQKCWKVFQKDQDGPCAFCPNEKLLDKAGKPTGVHAWEFQNTVNGKWFDCRDVAIPWIDGRMVRMEIATDITERKQTEDEREKLQDQLSQAQKAESLGRMAGAIAHHFNNQLSVVMGNLELVLNDLPDDAENRENLFQSFEAGRKAAEVSQQMLRYLGHISGRQTTINLSDVCHQSLALLQSSLPNGVTLNVDFPDPGPFIHADAGQIQ
ncbi:MAG: hypothetical protein LC660_17985, partial [Desulfobacteraceae bacterium]|nr:hypothetical protein [Desulfobacteraceae bacterium]